MRYIYHTHDLVTTHKSTYSVVGRAFTFRREELSYYAHSLWRAEGVWVVHPDGGEVWMLWECHIVDCEWGRWCFVLSSLRLVLRDPNDNIPCHVDWILVKSPSLWQARLPCFCVMSLKLQYAHDLRLLSFSPRYACFNDSNFQRLNTRWKGIRAPISISSLGLRVLAVDQRHDLSLELTVLLLLRLRCCKGTH